MQQRYIVAREPALASEQQGKAPGPSPVFEAAVPGDSCPRRALKWREMEASGGIWLNAFGGSLFSISRAAEEESMNDPFAIANQDHGPPPSEVLPDVACAESMGPASATAHETLQVTYFPSDSSVFFNSRYVTKAVPGRILWRLLSEISKTGRRSFTNRELRHEPELRLPAARDNLETRLLLLRRILESRFPRVRICRTGRGHFRVDLDCTVNLQVGS